MTSTIKSKGTHASIKSIGTQSTKQKISKKPSSETLEESKNNMEENLKENVEENVVSDVKPESTTSASVEKSHTSIVDDVTCVDSVEEDDTTSSRLSGGKSSDKPEEVNYSNKFLELLASYTDRIHQVNKELKELSNIGKTLEKEFNIVVKNISKHKKNKRAENRPLSGFAMPSLLTNELYSFLNIDTGTLVPRKDVTRMINEYITSNNLRDSKDKRKIIPDQALQKIFNCKQSDEITYFNLQTYMKHHFVKATT